MTEDDAFRKYLREKKKREKLEKLVAWQRIRIDKLQGLKRENLDYRKYIEGLKEPTETHSKRFCIHCGEELPFYKRADAIYCKKSCKDSVYYFKHRAANADRASD